ncbi:MAG TPA: hypothetical protein VGP76_23550 [Planctomycetaceae bacterium]|jgi:hypothetical protein|nr:hypothetical protein [Planctomycetaceae bacterium]
MYRHARSFSAVSWQVVVSFGVLVAATLPPRSGLLQDEVRHAARIEIDPKTSTSKSVPGYSLTEPHISGDWVVCVLYYGQISASHVPPTPEIRSTQPALVAVNLKNGQARQLSAPENRGAEFEQLIPLSGDGQCGVVVSQPNFSAGIQSGVMDHSFWKWTPKTGTIVGNVPWTPQRIFDFVLDPRICQVTTIDGRTSDGLKMRLCDIQSGKTTSFVLESHARLLAALNYYANPAPQALAPLSDGRSFIVMHRTADMDLADNSVIAEYVDPTAANGRRWRLRTSQIKEKVGHKTREVYPIPGIGPQSPFLGMVVTSDEDGDVREDCLTISSKTGAILKCLQPNKQDVTGALMSVDGKFMAWTTEGEDKKTQIWKKRASIVDVATGTIVSTLDLSNHIEVSLFAFQDADHVLGLSHNDLWRFAIARQGAHQLLFKLDPTEQN